MKNRSPSVERICAAAVGHFAERGYDASSLNEIAEQVGIRKASLYAHFAGKDALFLEVFSEAREQEAAFVHACFAAERANRLPGEHYCRMVAGRYKESAHLRFLLRTAYLPPAPLRAVIATGYEDHVQALRDLFCAALATGRSLAGTDIRMFADAYLGIVDSLHVELVYSNEAAFERRLTALWRIMADSLALASPQAPAKHEA